MKQVFYGGYMTVEEINKEIERLSELRDEILYKNSFEIRKKNRIMLVDVL